MKYFFDMLQNINKSALAAIPLDKLNALIILLTGPPFTAHMLWLYCLLYQYVMYGYGLAVG